MRSRFLRTTAGVLALGLASFSLAACSKDKSDDTTAATEAAASADTTAAAADTAAADTAAADTAAAGDTAAATEVAAADTEATPSTFVAEGVDPKVINKGGDIIYVAVANGNFLTLAKLLVICGCIDTFHEPGPFTVFAPTDAAFAKVPAETLAALAADKDKLAKVLTYHVVAGKVAAKDLGTEQKTVEGSTIKIATDDTGAVKINDSAAVVAADVPASNGVIHVIDSVILPPDL